MCESDTGNNNDYFTESDNESDETSHSESSDEADPLLQAQQWFPVNITDPPPAPPQFPFMSESKINIDLGETQKFSYYLMKNFLKFLSTK